MVKLPVPVPWFAPWVAEMQWLGRTAAWQSSVLVQQASEKDRYGKHNGKEKV